MLTKFNKNFKGIFENCFVVKYLLRKRNLRNILKIFITFRKFNIVSVFTIIN